MVTECGTLSRKLSETSPIRVLQRHRGTVEFIFIKNVERPIGRSINPVSIQRSGSCTRIKYSRSEGLARISDEIASRKDFVRVKVNHWTNKQGGSRRIRDGSTGIR